MCSSDESKIIAARQQVGITGWFLIFILGDRDIALRLTTADEFVEALSSRSGSLKYDTWLTPPWS
jgi:hypothetical protein